MTIFINLLNHKNTDTRKNRSSSAKLKPKCTDQPSVGLQLCKCSKSSKTIAALVSESFSEQSSLSKISSNTDKNLTHHINLSPRIRVWPLHCTSKRWLFYQNNTSGCFSDSHPEAICLTSNNLRFFSSALFSEGAAYRPSFIAFWMNL